jgi:PPOX class probable F420-dependent enzyme
MGRSKLARANYLSFETFRKSGVGVATPVWFAEEYGVFYLFSASDAGKIKRLRNSHRSRIAACTVSGRVTGAWVETKAYVLEDEADVEQALGALRRKYGWQMRATDLMSRLSGKMDKRAYIAVEEVSAV